MTATHKSALAAFEGAVRSQCALFAKHFAAGDFTSLTAAYYTEDATMLAPSAPKLTGRKALAEALGGLKASGIATAVLEPLHLDLRDDLGYEIGRARLGSATGQEQIARYLVIWQNIGGTWRCHVDMFAVDAI